MGKDKKAKPVEKEVIIPAPAEKKPKPNPAEKKPKPNVEGRIYKLKILMGKTTNQITYNVYKKELEELEK